MQTNSMFFVIDFGFKNNKVMRVCGAFQDYASALSHSNNLKKQYGEMLNLDIIPASMMIGNKREQECESFDFRKHIAFDISKMEIPMKCDICRKNATHFCNLHGGVYCVNHITNHEDSTLMIEKERVDFENP